MNVVGSIYPQPQPCPTCGRCPTCGGGPVFWPNGYGGSYAPYMAPHPWGRDVVVTVAEAPKPPTVLAIACDPD